jgi:hypothetical protein
MFNSPLSLDETRQLYLIHDFAQFERVIYFFAHSRCDSSQQAAINNDVALCHEPQAELDVVPDLLRVVAVA